MYLAFEEDKDDKRTLRLWSMKDGRLLDTTIDSSQYRQLLWTPDGHIAYWYHDGRTGDPHLGIFAIPELRTSPLPKTSEALDHKPHDDDDYRPFQWSPDDRYLAVQDGLSTYVYDLQGKQLTAPEGYSLTESPVWALQHILVHPQTDRYPVPPLPQSGPELGAVGLVAYDVATQHSTLLMPTGLAGILVGLGDGGGPTPAYAVHGNRVAMITQDADHQKVTLTLVDLDGKNRVVVKTDIPAPFRDQSNLLWVGDYIVLSTKNHLIWSYRDGSKVHNLDSFDGPFWFGFVGDGREQIVTFAGTFTENTPTIYPLLLNLKTGKERLLRDTPTQTWNAWIEWAPDDARFAVVLKDSLYVFDRNGEELDRVEHVMGDYAYDNIIWTTCN